MKTIQGNIVTVAEVIKDAADRTKTPNPPFFDRIQKWAKITGWICGGVGMVGLSVITSFVTAGVAVPLWVTITVGALSGIGTGVGFGASKVASMTTVDKELLSRPSNEMLQKK